MRFYTFRGSIVLIFSVLTARKPLSLFVFLFFFKERVSYGKLRAFSQKFAADFGRLFDITVKVIAVGGTASAAIIFCPAVAAAVFGENIAFKIFLTYLIIQFAFVNISEAEIFIADELMAGINITVGCNGNVFHADAAAQCTFYKAGRIV